MPYTAANVVDATNAKAGLILAMGRARLRRWHGRALSIPGSPVWWARSCWASASRLGKEPMPPHSLTMTMIGASLLWFGWFGFNAGSALEANGMAALALHEHVPGDRLRGAFPRIFAEWIGLRLQAIDAVAPPQPDHTGSLILIRIRLPVRTRAQL